MAAYRRVVCDSRHLQADCQEPGSGTLRSVIEYEVSLPFLLYSRHIDSAAGGDFIL